MKIAIFGAGAIGSYLGVRLHQAGAEVSMIARGAHLAAIRANGLTLLSEGKSVTVHPFATSEASEGGVQDYVFVTLKAHTLPAAAPEIAKLLGSETALITAMNGVPYWYFYGAPSPWRDRPIDSVDPGGTLWRTLPPHHAIGCVLYPWAELLAPGIVAQSTSNRLVIGEPDGSVSSRIQTLATLMRQGGLDAPVTATIRDELWLKLWGNLSMNPISALTGATIDCLAFDPDLRAVSRAMMIEAKELADGLGIRLAMEVEDRIDLAGVAGPRKTSMLHDFEHGKSLEIEPLLGAVVELADLTGHRLPLCRAILALARALKPKPPASAP
jgi:2-dehydropantoate 2-reductase